ncbi:MAG: glycosyltransferase family A protein [Synechococcaceae cyanobacterium ELA445]
MVAPYSIVTAARNRSGQLRRTAASISRFGSHAEHLIVDWSSEPPIRPADLPADPRLRLVRVEGERQWWLSRAYNRGFREAAHPWILKADADALLEEPFFRCFNPAAAHLQIRHIPGGLAGLGNLDDLGLFAVEAEVLRAVGGFNPWLLGWGFDDIDLFERLFLLPGTTVSHLSGHGSCSLPHGVAQRLGAQEQEPNPPTPWRHLRHTLQLHAELEANRTLATLSRAGRLPPPSESMGQEPADLLQRLPPELLEVRRRALLAGWCRLLIGRHALTLARSIPAPWLRELLGLLRLPERIVR